MFKNCNAANSFALLCLAAAGCLSSLPASSEPEYFGASVVAQGRQHRAVPGATVIRVSSSDCRRLQQYVPAPDVAYQPGVTKSGKRVAPADMTPPVDFGKTDDLAFTFSVRLKNPLPGGAGASGGAAGDVLGEAPIGTVELHNGVVSFNGVPLDDGQAQAVAAGCGAALKSRDSEKIRK